MQVLQSSFPVMPQLLNCLQNDAVAEAKGNSSDDTKPDDYETVKTAIEQAESMVQQAPPEQVPPAFRNAHKAAVDLLQGDNSRSSRKVLSIVESLPCIRAPTVAVVLTGRQQQQQRSGWLPIERTTRGDGRRLMMFDWLAQKGFIQVIV